MFVVITLVKTFNRKDLGAELDNTIYFTATMSYEYGTWLQKRTLDIDMLISYSYLNEFLLYFQHLVSILIKALLKSSLKTV